MASVLKCNRILRLYFTPKTISRFYSQCSTPKKGLVLGVYSNEQNKCVELTPAAEKYNQISGGKLLELIKLAGDVKPGKSFVFWGLEPNYQSVAVVGLKSQSKPDEEIENIDHNRESVRIAVSAGCNALQAVGVKDIHVESCGDAESAAESSILTTWKYQECKTKKEDLPEVQSYDLNQNDCQNWNKGVIKAQSQNMARKLADTPANLLTPTIFAEQATTILSPLGIEVIVHDQRWAEDQKMFSFLSVAKGSEEPPKFLELSYKKSDTAPYCLVGKGVTFDAGGISLKPGSNMDAMRADMTGAACVFSTLYGLAKLDAPVNVKALIPLVENMPSGKALKPGDVVKACNGKTICVDNTDAEGRLILADALCFASNFNPKWILDIATLTGAMMVALGSGATGVFTNSGDLYDILEKAGYNTGDRVWRMPLWQHYTKQVAENAAYDLNNIGKGKGGGSCTAAAFLREFVPAKTKWLHLDIAGVMGPEPNQTMPYLSKGMTGRPTRTLIEFIESQSTSC